MPPPPSLAVVYATDEDVVAIAGADFQVIAPPWSKFAEGKDGAFAAGDPWTLTAASNDFVAQGLLPNMIVQLTGPASVFRGGGDLLAIETVAPHALGLRRPGEAPGVGMPPGPAAGITGVSFLVTSLRKQIEDAAERLNEQFAVDPAVAGRTPADVTNVRIFRRLTVLQVVLAQYRNLNRAAKGDFADKVASYKDAYDVDMAIAAIKWAGSSSTQLRTATLSR